MSKKIVTRQPGVFAALGAAVLFGAGTPLAKLLIGEINPWLLAGLLYLGSGIGLSLYRFVSSAPAVKLPRAEFWWFAGAIVSGGIVGPVLLMFGLSKISASGASLLLNLESVFTAVLAWFAFKENFDRRIAVGMVFVVAGSVVLSLNGVPETNKDWSLGTDSALGALAIVGACFAWGIDNNFTRKVSLNDASWIASVKGLVAGTINLVLALVLGAAVPAALLILAAMCIGFLAYGLSLTLFVLGLRHLGSARTGAYFSVAPFVGAAIAILLGESVSLPLIAAAVLMAVGLALHLTEVHEHLHSHEAIEHEHEHEHDLHHQHLHVLPIIGAVKHSHRHVHEPLEHDHPHFPDMHHQHSHLKIRLPH